MLKYISVFPCLHVKNGYINEFFKYPFSNFTLKLLDTEVVRFAGNLQT